MTVLLCAALSGLAQTNIQFLPGSPSVYEAGGGAGTNVTVIVTRLPPDGDSTVFFTTTDLTAFAPGDYTTTSGTLTFTNGESFKIINIPIVDNLLTDGTRQFTVSLSYRAFR